MWTSTRIVAFDTETTGLFPWDGDRMIEFAAVELTVGADLRVERVRTIDFLINPEIPIPRVATQVTGIGDDDVADKPPFAERAREVRDLLTGAIIVAHNLPFDVGFVRAELGRAGMSWPVPRAEIDTLPLAQTRMSHLKGFTLEAICKELSVPLDGAHRATNDAEACGRCFVEMARRFDAPPDLDAMIAWADGIGPPPETGHVAIGSQGTPVFLFGEHAGKSVESHAEVLHWMTFALERRDGTWQHRFPDDVRSWAQRWLRVKASGRAAGGAKSFGAADWSLDPPAWQ